MNGFISLDCETTGVDLRYGAMPFLVTTCNLEGEIDYWEWDVNPLTRKPIIPEVDLWEIDQKMNAAQGLVLQNARFDARALQTTWPDEEWTLPWDKVWDTLIAAHILASNQPKDLTSLALIYLGVNIAPLEEEMEQCIQDARKIAKSEFPAWRIAKKGDPTMPSAKEKVWKFDMWLPRAIAKAKGYPTGECEVVNKNEDPFDVYIGRGSKWGNPFKIGVDGSRQDVIEKYRKRLRSNAALKKCLPELEGKRLGCFCKPLDCHGDVLQEELAKLRHPWWDCTANYANGDSAVTIQLFRVLKERLQKKGLWPVYEVRRKLPAVIYRIEDYGVTMDVKRTDSHEKRLKTQSEAYQKQCLDLADNEIDKLPINGASNALKHVLFDKFKLVSPKKTPKGEPSTDKSVLEHWLAELDDTTIPWMFIDGLKEYRKRQTALGYMKSYRLFGIPEGRHILRLFPSLNPTGTDTLRFTSQNPNAQQISKQDEVTLRYCFGPAPGREWWSLDAKNIELRLPAYYSGEQLLIELFERPDDPPYYGSTHLLNFHTVYQELWDDAVRKVGFEKAGPYCKKEYASTWYQWCKNGGFAVQYGAVNDERPGRMGTADRAFHKKGAHTKLEKRFGNLKKLNQACIAEAERTGSITTIPDRTIGGIGYPLRCTRTNYNKILPTVPLNYRIQGSAMWWMCKAMIRVDEYLRYLNSVRDEGYYVVLQVHDELVLDFPKGKGKEPWRTNLPKIRKVKRLMEQGGEDFVPEIPTPVGVEYHAVHWGEGKTLF